MNTVIHIADYGGSYSGNFVASLIALDKALHKEMGLRLMVVFSGSSLNSVGNFN